MEIRYLKKEALDDLCRRFAEAPGQRMNLAAFVHSMCSALGLGPVRTSPVNKVAELVELFAKCDPDNVGDITWTEMMHHGVTVDARDTRKVGGRTPGRSTFARVPDCGIALPSDVVGDNCKATAVCYLSEYNVLGVSFERSTRISFYRIVDAGDPLHGSRYSVGYVDTVRSHAPQKEIYHLEPVIGMAAFGCAGALVVACGFHMRVVNISGLQTYKDRASGLTPRLLCGPGFDGTFEVHTAVPQRGVCLVGCESIGPGAHRCKVVSWSASGELLVWYLQINRDGDWSGRVEVAMRLRGSLSVHAGTVTSVAAAPDVGLIASGGLDGELLFWGVRGQPDGYSGRRGIHDEATDISVFAKAGRTAAGIFFVRRVALVSPATRGGAGGGRHRSEDAAHPPGVRTLCYVPSSRIMVAAATSGDLFAYDLMDPGFALLYCLRGHATSVSSLALLEPIGTPFRTKIAAAASVDDLFSDACDSIGPSTQKHESEIASLDDLGIIRVWNLSRTFSMPDTERCLQLMASFDITEDEVDAISEKLSRRVTVESKTSSILALLRLLPFVASRKLPEVVRGSSYASTRQPSLLPPMSPICASDKPVSASQPDMRIHEPRPPQHVSAVSSEERGASEPSLLTDSELLRTEGALLALLGPPTTVFEARANRAQIVPLGSEITCIVPLPCSCAVFCVGGRDITILDAATGCTRTRVFDVLPAPASARCAAPSHSGRRVFVGCQDGFVVTVDAFTGRVLRNLPPHGSDVTSIAVAHACDCGGSGACGCSGNSRASGCDCTAVVPGSGKVVCPSWRGCVVLTCSTDGTFHLVDEESLINTEHSITRVNNGNTSTIGKFHLGDFLMRSVSNAHGDGIPLTAIAYNPRSSTVATGDDCGSVRVWDFSTLAPVACLRGHYGELSALLAVPGLPVLVSGDTHGIVNVWLVNGMRSSTSNTSTTDQRNVKCLATFSAVRGVVVPVFEATTLSQAPEFATRTTTLSQAPEFATAALMAKRDGITSMSVCWEPKTDTDPPAAVPTLWVTDSTGMLSSWSLSFLSHVHPVVDSDMPSRAFSFRPNFSCVRDGKDFLHGAAFRQFLSLPPAGYFSSPTVSTHVPPSAGRGVDAVCTPSCHRNAKSISTVSTLLARPHIAASREEVPSFGSSTSRSRRLPTSLPKVLQSIVVTGQNHSSRSVAISAGRFRAAKPAVNVSIADLSESTATGGVTSATSLCIESSAGAPTRAVTEITSPGEILPSDESRAVGTSLFAVNSLRIHGTTDADGDFIGATVSAAAILRHDVSWSVRPTTTTNSTYCACSAIVPAESYNIVSCGSDALICVVNRNAQVRGTTGSDLVLCGRIPAGGKDSTSCGSDAIPVPSPSLQLMLGTFYPPRSFVQQWTLMNSIRGGPAGSTTRSQSHEKAMHIVAAASAAAVLARRSSLSGSAPVGDEDLSLATPQLLEAASLQRTSARLRTERLPLTRTGAWLDAQTGVNIVSEALTVGDNGVDSAVPTPRVSKVASTRRHPGFAAFSANNHAQALVTSALLHSDPFLAMQPDSLHDSAVRARLARGTDAAGAATNSRHPTLHHRRSSISAIDIAAYSALRDAVQPLPQAAAIATIRGLLGDEAEAVGPGSVSLGKKASRHSLVAEESPITISTPTLSSPRARIMPLAAEATLRGKSAASTRQQEAVPTERGIAAAPTPARAPTEENTANAETSSITLLESPVEAAAEGGGCDERSAAAPTTPLAAPTTPAAAVAAAAAAAAGQAALDLIAAELKDERRRHASVEHLLRARNPALMRRLQELKSRATVSVYSMSADEIAGSAAPDSYSAHRAYEGETPEEESAEDRLLRGVALGIVADLVRGRQVQAPPALSTLHLPPVSASDFFVTGRILRKELTGRQEAADSIALSPAGGLSSPQQAATEAASLRTASTARPGSAVKPLERARSACPPTSSGSAALMPGRARIDFECAPKSLTPEEMLQVVMRPTIGGQMKGDVDVFAQLCHLVDPNRTGTLPTTAVLGLLADPGAEAADSAASLPLPGGLTASTTTGHLPYTRRQLAVLFCGADHDRIGTIRVDAFAAVLFPSSSVAQLREIAGYVMYKGPPPDTVREKQAHNSPELLALLRELFDAYDTDGSGTISQIEVEAAFQRGGLRQESQEDGESFGAGDDIDFDTFVRLLGPHLVGS